MRASKWVFVLPLGLVSASPVNHSDVLRFGSPESVDMLPGPLEAMVGNLTAFTEARNWTTPTHNQVLPVEPGGVTVVARHGVVVSYFAFGKRTLWAGVNGTTGVKLPDEKQQDTELDTIYDAASLTKMFTTVAVLRCIDQGLFSLNGTVATWLPEYAAGGKELVTVLNLLSHTSGLPASATLWNYPDYASRVDNILSYELNTAPGEAYLYSDIGFMSLMLLVEKVTGKKIDQVIDEIGKLLGLEDTYFNRGNEEDLNSERYQRQAPTEFQAVVVGPPSAPDRPQPVRTVHDENAWFLDGVSGHAGLFTTALDAARLCQMILNGGTYGGERVLSRRSVGYIFTNWIGSLSGTGAGRGAGFELNQTSTAGPMASMQTASHTGFTGTSMVMDRESGTLFVHFANRVHPSREWSSNTIVRQTLGAWVATALGRDVDFPIHG